MCGHCPQGYHTAKERTRHQHSHDKPYKCHDCYYTNICQDHLSTHMFKKHSKTVSIVRTERKKKRESAKAAFATNMESNTVIDPVLHIILPQQNNMSVQTSPEQFDAGSQTKAKAVRFVGAQFQVDDCEEVSKSDSTTTRFTQTVTVIRNTSWQKIILNPHPDTV